MVDKPEERRADYLLIGGMAEKIDAIDGRTKRMETKVNKHGEDLAALNVKAGLWGGIAGLVTVVPLYVKFFFAKGGGH